MDVLLTKELRAWYKAGRDEEFSGMTRQRLFANQIETEGSASFLERQQSVIYLECSVFG